MASKNADTAAGAAAPVDSTNAVSLPDTSAEVTTVPLPDTVADLPKVAEPEPAEEIDEPQRPGTTAPAPQSDRPAPPLATVLPLDQYHGLGGDYVIGEDGVRRPAPTGSEAAAVAA